LAKTMHEKYLEDMKLEKEKKVREQRDYQGQLDIVR